MALTLSIIAFRWPSGTAFVPENWDRPFPETLHDRSHGRTDRSVAALPATDRFAEALGVSPSELWPSFAK